MSKAARRLLDHEIARLTVGASLRDRALIWACLGAGLRAAEAAALCCGDVGQSGAILVREGKGGYVREVYLTGQALEAIQQWRSTLEHTGDDAPLFPSRKRRGGKPSPMNPTSAVSLVKLAMERAGVTNASSHSLRRTHAQSLEERGTNVRIIQRQLGHKHIQTTERYLAANPPGHRDAVRNLEFDLNV